jgi:prepilin-type N-terminal cleavage/methylation domain-containing protein
MRNAAERGFTVVELIVALAIIAIVTGAMFDVLNPAHGILQAQPEISDMQQRLRAGATAIENDLLIAGAGPHSHVGSLRQRLATVLPFRRGERGADPPGSAFADRVSLMYVPVGAPQAMTTLDMASEAADIPVAPQGAGRFLASSDAIIFDESGAFDVFRVAGVTGSGLLHANPLSKPYAAGSTVAAIVEATYWLKSTSLQLMEYDGHQTDHPMADNIVDLQFEYFGEPQSPAVVRDLSDPEGPWTTYGPRPPPPADDDPATLTYGAGENCLFVPVNGNTVARPEMPPLAAAGESLVNLDLRSFTDGPWCSDPASPNRFDADLLRIRRIRVRLRVQAASDTLRGAGSLFKRAGNSFGGSRYVPDQEVVFDVVPRNLNLDR